MNYDEEEYDPYAGFGGGGCPVHGEDYMRECSVCGEEFCALCFPNSDVCEECTAQGRDLDDEEGFGGEESEEMKIVAELAPDDPELDQETEEALKSFGDLDDESAPSDDVFQEAEKRSEAVAKAAAAKKKAAAKKAAGSAKKAPKAAPSGAKAAKKAPAKGKKR